MDQDKHHHLDTRGLGGALRAAFRPVFGFARSAADRKHGTKEADEAIAKMKAAAVSLKAVAHSVKRVTERDESDPLVIAMRELSEGMRGP